MAEAERLAGEVQQLARLLLHPETIEVDVAPSPSLVGAHSLDVYGIMLSTADGSAAEEHHDPSQDCPVVDAEPATLFLIIVTNTAGHEMKGPMEFEWSDGSSLTRCYTGEATVRLESSRTEADDGIPARRVPVANGVLKDSDSFPAYGTRIYQLHMDKDTMLAMLQCITNAE